MMRYEMNIETGNIAWNEKERAVMRADDGLDMRISNWTLATRTRPGRRDVQAPQIVAPVRRPEQEATS